MDEFKQESPHKIKNQKTNLTIQSTQETFHDPSPPFA